MALSKQNLPVPFAQGVDTKTDPKQVLVGKLLRAKNVVFETLMSVKKRNGYDANILQLTDLTAVDGATQLAKFKTELGVIASNAYYGMSGYTSKLTAKGAIYSAKATTSPIVQSSANHSLADSITVDGLIISIFINSTTREARYSVLDSVTNSSITANAVLAAAATQVQVAAINNTVYLLYSVGGSIYFKYLSALNPSALSSQTTLANNLDADRPVFDAIGSSSRVVIAYNSTVSGSALRVITINSNSVVGGGLGFSGTTDVQALDVYVDPDLRIVLTWAESEVVKAMVLNFGLTVQLMASVTLEAVSGVRNLTTTNTAQGAYQTWYEVPAPTRPNYTIKTNTFLIAGTTGTASTFKMGLGLAAKAFTVLDQIYIVAAHESELQNTIFVLDSTGRLASKVAPGLSGGHSRGGTLPHVTISGTQASFASLLKGKNVSDNGTFYGLLGVNNTKLEFGPRTYTTAEMGDNLHIAGGSLYNYDGYSITEQGFNLFPEGLSQVPVDSGQGEMSAGDYAYQAVYRWTDNFGQDHRSAPSIPLEVNFDNPSPVAIISTTTPIRVVDKSVTTAANNDNTLTISVAAAASNPLDKVLIAIGGSAPAVTVTVTPNSGTNNGGVPVSISTAQLVEFINTGLVSGKNIVVSGSVPVGPVFEASGGDSTLLAHDGEGDGEIGTFWGGGQIFASASMATTTPIQWYSNTVGTTTNGATLQLVVAAPFANATNSVEITMSGSAGAMIATVTPNNGFNNSGVTVGLTTAELAEAFTNGSVRGKNVVFVDPSTLKPTLHAYGGGAQILAHSGEGDGLTITLQGGAQVTSAQIRVPTLRLTEKQNVVVELYRTEDNGSIYYLVSSPVSPTLNNPMVDYVDIRDGLSDDDLISRELLYTTGNVLDNDAPPAASVVASHTASNRLVLLGLENPNQIQFSKIWQPGKPVEFSSYLVKNIDPVGGAVTTGVAMDEKFIVFEQDACFWIGGAGPTNTGEQDSSTEPEKISTDIGCTDPASVVVTPLGVMFKSRKGIYLLSRSLQLQYVGAPVEGYNSLTISSAKVIGEFNQVRFTTSDGDCLVYNYNLNIWATFDNHQALSAEVILNDYYYLRTDGVLFKENRASFSDNGSSIRLMVELGWLSLAQLQGYQRVYSMQVLGAYKGPHTLTIKAAYDFNEAYTQQVTIDPVDFISGAAYGVDSPYGSGSPYGGNGSVYQAEFNFKTQKCQAIKLLIQDEQDSANEGLSLSAITLRVGVKQGLNKVSKSRSYGVS